MPLQSHIPKLVYSALGYPDVGLQLILMLSLELCMLDNNCVTQDELTLFSSVSTNFYLTQHKLSLGIYWGTRQPKNSLTQNKM